MSDTYEPYSQFMDNVGNGYYILHRERNVYQPPPEAPDAYKFHYKCVGFVFSNAYGTGNISLKTLENIFERENTKQHGRRSFSVNDVIVFVHDHKFVARAKALISGWDIKATVNTELQKEVILLDAPKSYPTTSDWDRARKRAEEVIAEQRRNPVIPARPAYYQLEGELSVPASIFTGDVTIHHVSIAPGNKLVFHVRPKS